MTLRRAWAWAGWAAIALIVALSLIPDPPGLNSFEQSDKLAHAAAYGLTAWWIAHLHGRTGRLWLVAGLLALGVAVEVMQGMTGYRSFDLVDMAADAVGVFLGWLAAPPRGPSLLAALEARLRR